MAIVRWDPLRELQLMQEQMSRLLEMSRERSGAAPFEDQLWQPAADVYEDETTVVVKMELPEVEQSAIEVRIEGNQLVVSGERQLAGAEGKFNYLRVERSYGPFRRTFALPAGIDEERISAGCERGILKIVLPKCEEHGVRHIEVAT